jgi:hypothetical protein
MDLRGNIPTFIHVSDGKLHDVNALVLNDGCAPSKAKLCALVSSSGRIPQASPWDSCFDKAYDTP